jgi:hypothetical protein
MIFIYIRTCILFLFIFLQVAVGNEKDPNLFVADPFILEDNGVYYLYGTSSRDGIVA